MFSNNEKCSVQVGNVHLSSYKNLKSEINFLKLPTFHKLKHFGDVQLKPIILDNIDLDETKSILNVLNIPKHKLDSTRYSLDVVHYGNISVYTIFAYFIILIMFFMFFYYVRICRKNVSSVAEDSPNATKETQNLPFNSLSVSKSWKDFSSEVGGVKSDFCCCLTKSLDQLLVVVG